MIPNINLGFSEIMIYFMKKLSISSTWYLKLYTGKQQKLLRFKDKDFILFHFILFENKNLFSPLPPKLPFVWMHFVWHFWKVLCIRLSSWSWNDIISCNIFTVLFVTFLHQKCITVENKLKILRKKVISPSHSLLSYKKKENNFYLHKPEFCVWSRNKYPLYSTSMYNTFKVWNYD